MINVFRGEYGFLSNFYPSKIMYEGISYMNAEAAFQAQKVLDEDGKKQFSNLPPVDAKRLGRKVNLRADWNEIRDEIMYKVVLAKFSQNKVLKQKLLETGDSRLVEGNYHNDTYWGVSLSTGVGKNKLGIILERVRKELNGKSE